MILADVGNRHVHIYEDGTVLHLDIDDAIDAFGQRIVHYICVSDSFGKKIMRRTYWKDISDRISLPGAYEGMGVDRKALCLSRGDGIYIDAGSALTIDRISSGHYEGGIILPGLGVCLKAYGDISPALKTDPDWSVPGTIWPKGTKEQISYGIIASVVKPVLEMGFDNPTIFCTGGDGRIVSSWFDSAVYDEAVVFEGILKAANI